jgi:pyruvate/2-oxoglutarate dehydrogenase complex dihydrolipoamide dehydrogenase (E3) component
MIWPMSDTEYDVIVVGGGPPGENAAARARRGGLSAVLVESELVGGECSYWACMPSKALLRPVELRDAVKRMPGLSEPQIAVARVLARRDDFTSHHDDKWQVQWLTSEGIDLVRGHGRLAGERRVEVTDAAGGRRALTARHAVVLATGTTATVPPIPGLREARPWTSREATNVRDVPRRLFVLGGGVVAVEMAQAMRGLGSEAVTIAEMAPGLLGRMEPFAGELLADRLRADGVDVRLGAEVTGVRRDGAAVTVTFDGTDPVEAEEILVAVGRTPGTVDAGVETVGLRPGDYVRTDDTMRAEGVHGGWLYAIGDVTGRALLTHMGKYQARVCGDVIAARATGQPVDAPRFHATADDAMVPQVVFTDPQCASVGLTEDQARDRGLDVRSVEYEIGNVAGAALHADGYGGRAKLVVDEARSVLVGATFVGPDVADLLHSATVAVVGEVPLDRLWHAVPSYPTISEVWLRLLEAYGL